MTPEEAGPHPRPLSRGRARGVRLSWSIRQRNLDVAAMQAEVRWLGADFPAAEAAKQLAAFEDYYHGWQTELRYFFFRREEWLARQLGLNFSNEQWSRIWASNASDSIEHIRAQSGGAEWVHRIGNLVLLPPRLNSRLLDKSPGDKKEDYVRTGLLVGEEAARQLPPWGYTQAMQREQELIAWAATEWADSPIP